MRQLFINNKHLLLTLPFNTHSIQTQTGELQSSLALK